MTTAASSPELALTREPDLRKLYLAIRQATETLHRDVCISGQPDGQRSRNIGRTSLLVTIRQTAQLRVRESQQRRDRDENGGRQTQAERLGQRPLP